MTYLRNGLMMAAGAYFLVNGLRSGHAGSAVLGALIAALCVFVAVTGKTHPKFRRDASAKHDYDDQQMLDAAAAVGKKFRRVFTSAGPVRNGDGKDGDKARLTDAQKTEN